MDILKPKLDVVFKMIFGDERNMNIIVSFVAALMNIPKEYIKKISIMNVEIPIEEYGQKFERLDLRMETYINKRSEIVNIEIQILSEPNYEDRSLLYWSRNFSTQLKSGDTYSMLKRTVCLNIINFNLFECENYYSDFTLMEKKRHEILSDKIEICFFELRKLKKYMEKCGEEYTSTPMENWLNFVNAETEADLMLMEKKITDPAMNDAIVVLKTLSGDEKAREIAYYREKRLHDEASVIEYAKKQGREEGREEGIKEGREEGIKEGREEGIKEGREEGIKEGTLLILINLAKEGLITVEDAARKAGMSEDEFEDRMKMQENDEV
ncbi:MAG: Rpn family recombination-promoting nuclease/putative transposase [Firmicutes bacterium]|nr:Rpn family recombination-promoting nuclease/putative transposase [Bacillota bacterium]